MKAAKAWCIAGLMAVTGLVSCGKDEASGGEEKGGAGVVITGGNAGAGGTRNDGGSAGSAGAAGGGASQTKLGSGCVNDNQCADAKAPGLKCVTAMDPVLGPGAP